MAAGLVVPMPTLPPMMESTLSAETVVPFKLFREIPTESVPETVKPKIAYAAAAISGGPNTDGGRTFVDFLKTAEASDVFRRYGFILSRQ